VYAVLLDASQAFDKVHYNTLFNLLLDKNMCPLIVKFVFRSYLQQNVRVKWNNTFSHSFQVSNGVKQGGVLSPILFGVYIDVLLLELSRAGNGCRIGINFCGAFGYADDILFF